VVISGLVDGIPYVFTAFSVADVGTNSEPAPVLIVTLSGDAASQMAGLLDETADLFLQEFGEPIKYRPRGGGIRDISAILNYGQPEGIAAPHGNAPLSSIEVANDPVKGISSSEVDKGGDEVLVPVRIGQDPEWRPITKILSQDAGMMSLEVR
jgi:hypothetical protein